jgi:hypothetical protein
MFRGRIITILSFWVEALPFLLIALGAVLGFHIGGVVGAALGAVLGWKAGAVVV